MRPPIDERKAADLTSAIRGLRDSSAFLKFMEWIDGELKHRDAENRVVGHENTTSEAHALGVISEYVAACWRPEQTAANSNPDAESESAGPFT